MNRPFQGKIVTMPNGERYRAMRDVLFQLDQDMRCKACDAKQNWLFGRVTPNPCAYMRCWDNVLNECYVWERLTSEEENENDSNESSRK